MKPNNYPAKNHPNKQSTNRPQSQDNNPLKNQSQQKDIKNRRPNHQIYFDEDKRNPKTQTKPQKYPNRHQNQQEQQTQSATCWKKITRFFTNLTQRIGLRRRTDQKTSSKYQQEKNDPKQEQKDGQEQEKKREEQDREREEQEKGKQEQKKPKYEEERGKQVDKNKQKQKKLPNQWDNPHFDQSSQNINHQSDSSNDFQNQCGIELNHSQIQPKSPRLQTVSQKLKSSLPNIISHSQLQTTIQNNHSHLNHNQSSSVPNQNDLQPIQQQSQDEDHFRQKPKKQPNQKQGKPSTTSNASSQQQQTNGSSNQSPLDKKKTIKKQEQKKKTQNKSRKSKFFGPLNINQLKCDCKKLDCTDGKECTCAKWGKKCTEYCGCADNCNNIILLERFRRGLRATLILYERAKVENHQREDEVNGPRIHNEEEDDGENGFNTVNCFVDQGNKVAIDMFGQPELDNEHFTPNYIIRRDSSHEVETTGTEIQQLSQST